MNRRLTLSYLAVTVFVLLVLEIPLVLFFADREESRLLSAIERDALVLATIYEDALQSNTPYSLAPAIDYAARTGTRVVVVNSVGQSIVDTANEAYQDFTNRSEIVNALAGTIESGTRFSATLGGNLAFASVPVASGGDIYGAIRLTFPTTQIGDRVRQFSLSLAGVAAVVLAAITAVGWVVARSVTRPIERLRQGALMVGEGNLDVRVDVGDAPPELSELAKTFNNMASRLQELLKRHREFVADASHQLRTPLTALRLRLENVEDSIEPEAESDFQWALRETDRLGEVINQLLELARVEEGEKKPTVIEVAQLIRDRADTWSTVANQSGVELVVDAPPETWISAVDGTVEQILDNLLSNALKVAPSESTVTLRVIPAGQIVEVHVIDEGPGLTEADRVNAMQRFWRGAAEGTGLGLAIVNRLAEASGGTARLDSSASGGVDALITMPAVSPQTTHLSSRRAHQSSATSQPDGT